MRGEHIQYMQQALALAERGRLTVSPNPMVGCLIVKDGRIVGEGYHLRAGEPHAEIHALNAAGPQAKNATVYVTLEPCAHHGRTPPCTDALIQAGIKTIYIAAQDPNPLVSGKGIAILQSHGISVHVGILKAEAEKLNEIFFHYMKHKRPFVIAKWAMSLDGKTVTAAEDDKSISSAHSRQHSHAIREQVDAILVGANTAKNDDPALTVRFSKTNGSNIKQPIRIVLSSNGQLPSTLKLFRKDMPAKTIVVIADTCDDTFKQSISEMNVEVLKLPRNNEGQIDLNNLLDKLGELGITSLLVEGGMTVHESFFSEQLVNKVCVYIAPVIIGTLPKKQWLSEPDVSQIAHDILFTGTTAASEETLHV